MQSLHFEKLMFFVTKMWKDEPKFKTTLKGETVFIRDGINVFYKEI